MNQTVSKQVSQDGSTTIGAPGALFTFRRLRPGALLVTFTGSDLGQFSYAALDEVQAEMRRWGELELFFDAEHTELISVEVSRAWTHFFAVHRGSLRRVSVLTGSKLVNLTVAIAQHLSQTGNLIQIYTDRSLFDELVAAAAR